MFETAALSYGSQGHRVWATCMGVTGQAVALAALILVHIWFPAALPTPQAVMTWLAAPAPPPAPPAAPAPSIAVPKMRPLQYVDYRLYQPARVPSRVVAIEDPPLPPGASAAGGAHSGPAIGDLMIGILTPPSAPPAAPAVRAPAPAPAVPVRVRVGGAVRPAEVIRRVEPVYPVLALQARVWGVVELEGVVGLDGRIHELKAKSGPPLLIAAAIAAVSQWLFRPTTLNGDPVETIQPVDVKFILR